VVTVFCVGMFELLGLLVSEVVGDCVSGRRSSTNRRAARFGPEGLTDRARSMRDAFGQGIEVRAHLSNSVTV
jgi:hypothetical protein